MYFFRDKIYIDALEEKKPYLYTKSLKVASTIRLHQP